MHKFGFSIRTRTGHKVDNIKIMARDSDEAERRLRQMYNLCEIVRCQESSSDHGHHPLKVDSIVGLISRHTAVHKVGTH